LLAAVVGLRGFLSDRLDQQLADTGWNFPASLEHATGKGEPDADNQADIRYECFHFSIFSLI